MLSHLLMTSEFDYSAIETGYYDRIYRSRKGIQSKWHWLKFRHIAELLAARGALGKDKRLLDLACGPGTFIGSLDSEVDAVGVDIAQPQVDYAQSQYATAHKRFVRIDGGRLPFDDGVFDAVTIIELIEHLTMQQNLELLIEARRVLKPSTGVLIVSTPNYHSGWPVLEAMVNRVAEVSYAEQHITRFHRRRLASLLGQAGLREIEVRRYQGFAPFGALLSWTFSDWLYRVERLPSRLHGFLLVATATK